MEKLRPYDERLLEPGALDMELGPGEEIVLGRGLFDPADIPTYMFGSSVGFEGSEALAEGIMEAAKNPGLGVRALHGQGITGEGVNVAVIDQNLLRDHPEYRDCIAAYYDSGCGVPEDEGSLHGPAVLSLLAGKTVGVAPGAKVWYAAAPFWEKDAAYCADCLRWIIEQNRLLPEGEKIRVVSVSAAPVGYNAFANAEQWAEAVAEAQAEGILVIDCRSREATGFVSPGYGDPEAPEDVTKCRRGYPDSGETANNDTPREGEVFAPCSYRTTAQEYAPGQYTYTYWGTGGQSWGVPYVAGVLALGWQVNPELDAQTMKDLLFQSAWVSETGCHMIDPPAFIELVGKTGGRACSGP